MPGFLWGFLYFICVRNLGHTLSSTKKFKFARVTGICIVRMSSIKSYEIILHVHLVHFEDDARDDDKFNRCGGGRVII